MSYCIQKLHQIMRKLKIKNAGDFIYNNILNTNINLDDIVPKYNKNKFIGGILEERKEGKETKINHNGVEYRFSSYHEDNLVYYFLEENNVKCATIIINKNKKEAKIFEINGYEGCFPKNMKGSEKSGSTLLKVVLNLIEQVKKKYKLNYVSLMDNSKKECYNVDGKIIFSKMMVLLIGETWYGKYGFVPYEKDSDTITKNMQKAYKNNKIIMKSAKMNDVKDFDKIFYKAIKKSKLTEKMNDGIIGIYEDYKKENGLIRDFLSNLLDENIFLGVDKKISGSCVVFFYFYDDLYKKLNLYDFHNKSFYKKI
jgi:hypothetical protein